MGKEIFNFGRFRKYFVHDLLRCIKQVGLATLLTGLIPVIMLVCSACMFAAIGISDWSFDLEFTAGIAIIVFSLYFLFMPIPCYGELTDKRKGSNFLMLPASHTEKYTSMLINCLILFPLGLTVLYLSLDTVCAMLFPSRYEGFAAEILFEKNLAILLLFLPAMISAAGLCGSLLFRKRKASKTFLTCTASFIVLLLILLTISEKGWSPSSSDKVLTWDIFQTFCTLCLLAYTYIKTKNIQL